MHARTLLDQLIRELSKDLEDRRDALERADAPTLRGECAYIRTMKQRLLDLYTKGVD